MEVKFKIVYSEEVVIKDIPNLNRKYREIIKKAIEDKLITHPEIFGKPLRTSLAGYRKLRVGDYRVIFEISKHTTIIIWMIGHRKDIYQKILKRIK
jgi:mRNA interferase RelE/StbE